MPNVIVFSSINSIRCVLWSEPWHYQGGPGLPELPVWSLKARWGLKLPLFIPPRPNLLSEPSLFGCSTWGGRTQRFQQ